MVGMWKESLAFTLVLASTALVYGSPELNPWPSYRQPAPGPASSIGEYSKGCLQGAEPLPLDGIGYQVMRPSRGRYFGHPALVDFVQTLGQKVKKQRLGVLLVGDLSQARGGRTASSHASHQTGLDVDIWYFHPVRARKRPLPLVAREEMQAESVVDARQKGMVPRWRRHVTKVLRLAAQDARVDRLFVNPAIKRSLCMLPPAQRGWLRKVRPWYGHADHFHVRLGCRPGDGACQNQAAPPPGDGCDQLGKWFKPRPKKVARKPQATTKPKVAPAKSGLAAYKKAVNEGRGWPEQCNALLEMPPENERLAMPTPH